MKKILYLHGFESKGVKKVRHLATKGVVYAPYMDYEENPETIFEETLQIVDKLKPDLIVGSSMGGYFAHKLATHVKTELLLFNPATINEWTYYDNLDIETSVGEEEITGTVVIGGKDEIINPDQNTLYYTGLLEIKHEPNMEHRIPSEIFNKHVDSITS